MKKLNCIFHHEDKSKRVFPRLLGILCFLLLALINNKSYAQDPSLNCVSGCTSKDVQIQKAYLVQSDGTNFPANYSCNAGDLVTVRLALDLATNTPRVGVYVFANVRNLANNEILGDVSECFSIALASGGTTRVVFNETANWPCGISVKLTDVYIGWGTGNTDFCAASSAPRCGATKSKCFLLPPGEFIPIVIPVGVPAVATQCSTDPGGTTSVFNLHNLDATILNGQTGTVTYFTNSSLTTAIAPNESAYNSASTTVYAKITNGGVSSSAISVTLIVNQTPNLTITNPAAVCSPNTVNLTAAAVTTGSTLPSGTTLGYFTDAAATTAVSTPTAVGAGTYYIKASSNTTPNCTDIKPVIVTVIANPIALVLTGSSICSSAPGTGTISSSTSGPNTVSYQLYNSSNAPVQGAKPGTGAALTWTTLAAGNGYYVIATGAAPTNCTSTSATVNVTSVTNPTALVLTGSSICSSAPGTGTISSSTSGPNTVSYQLYNSSNAPVQAAKPGTGAALTWTNIAVGNGYYVIATGAVPTNCTSTSSTVNVTSVTNPIALVLTGSSICSSAPGTGTISSSTSGPNTVSYQLYNSSNAPVQGAKPGTGAALTWTNLAAGNGYYVIATGAAPTNCTSTSATVNVTSVTNPSAPSVTYNAPACDATTFSVTVTGVVNGATYTIKNKDGNNIAGVSPGNSVVAPNTNNIVFSNIPAGSGYQVTVQIGTCTSTANSCGTPTPPGARIQSQNQSEVIIGEQTTVKAYPNPFSDRVKFMVTSDVAGNGNLEIYNMMGQKIKTVYQGYIAAGTQTFELSLSKQQVANLVYVLRVGDKKVTGKILQINQ